MKLNKDVRTKNAHKPCSNRFLPILFCIFVSCKIPMGTVLEVLEILLFLLLFRGHWCYTYPPLYYASNTSCTNQIRHFCKIAKCKQTCVFAKRLHPPLSRPCLCARACFCGPPLPRRISYLRNARSPNPLSTPY